MENILLPYSLCFKLNNKVGKVTQQRREGIFYVMVGGQEEKEEIVFLAQHENIA